MRSFSSSFFVNMRVTRCTMRASRGDAISRASRADGGACARAEAHGVSGAHGVVGAHSAGFGVLHRANARGRSARMVITRERVPGDLLVVDDDVDAVELLRELLVHRGYDVE